MAFYAASLFMKSHITLFKTLPLKVVDLRDIDFTFPKFVSRIFLHYSSVTSAFKFFIYILVSFLAFFLLCKNYLCLSILVIPHPTYMFSPVPKEKINYKISNKYQKDLYHAFYQSPMMRFHESHNI